ncbi:hypothetical protein [Litorihabitans aurantiacus]|uniref:Uncharacterized protein n=1 Tax=Litorihabitans aurantiacus TaxID=1930061 RepID=A0AA37XCJ7_9MICO|nr:hypothetical protein [Litorihabitans aurantiacus]GMA30196.1 hypothetical protein GCM10025875_01880 [Litorihabitans aurantiacus]
MTTPSDADRDAALHAAVDRLVAAGEEAGLEADAVRHEASVLAAAVAEAGPGAPADWVRAFERGAVREFFAAAAGGRRWRTAPTETLVALRLSGASPSERERATAYADALVEVAAAAAVGLGTPSALVAQAASEVAAAQRGAPVAPAVPPGSGGTSGPTTAGLPSAVDLTSFGGTGGAPAAPPVPPGLLPEPALNRGLQGLPAVGEILEALRGGAQPAAPAALGQPGAGATTAAPQAAGETAVATEEQVEVEAEELPPSRSRWRSSRTSSGWTGRSRRSSARSSCSASRSCAPRPG